MSRMSALTRPIARLLGSNFLELSISKHLQYIVKHKVYEGASTSPHWAQVKRFKAFEYAYLFSLTVRVIIGSLILKSGVSPETYRAFDPTVGNVVMKISIVDPDLLLICDLRSSYLPSAPGSLLRGIPLLGELSALRINYRAYRYFPFHSLCLFFIQTSLLFYSLRGTQFLRHFRSIRGNQRPP